MKQENGISTELNEEELAQVTGGIPKPHSFDESSPLLSSSSSSGHAAVLLSPEPPPTTAKSVLTHPVSQAFAAGVVGILAVKGIKYAANGAVNH
jgi:bacteriocin-like protein